MRIRLTVTLAACAAALVASAPEAAPPAVRRAAVTRATPSARAGQAQQAGPGYLSILSAGIKEEAGVAPGTGRVSFRLTLAAAPPCAADHPDVSYAFLVDRDRATGTGVRANAFPELGIDGAVTARCSPPTGRFSSPTGEVIVQPSPDGVGTSLEITADLRPLAPADLHWIAFARDGRRAVRLPATGYGVWQSVDAWIH